MTTQTESVTGLFEQAFDNLRKTAESNVEMQQEMFRKWNANWPGFPQPQSALARASPEVSKGLGEDRQGVVEHGIARVLDEQYRLAIESLEEAFRVAQASDPQECCQAVRDAVPQEPGGAARIGRVAGERDARCTEQMDGIGGQVGRLMTTDDDGGTARGPCPGNRHFRGG